MRAANDDAEENQELLRYRPPAAATSVLLSGFGVFDVEKRSIEMLRQRTNDVVVNKKILINSSVDSSSSW
jgi:hypothetical protein